MFYLSIFMLLTTASDLRKESEIEYSPRLVRLPICLHSWASPTFVMLVSVMSTHRRLPQIGCNTCTQLVGLDNTATTG